VFAVEVPSEVRHFEIHRLPPGFYYARVSTIDGELFESRPSDPYAFELAMARLEAPGEHQPAATFDFADATEEPRPVVVFPGARFVPPADVACAGAEDAGLALRDPGPASIACTDAEGRALGVVAVEVAQVELSIAGPGGALRIDRGRETELSVLIDSSLEIPRDARIVGGDGVEVLEQSRDGGTVRLRVRALASAPERVELSMVLGEGSSAIGAIGVEVRSPEETRASQAALAPILPQAFGVVPWAGLVGVRDVRRAGLSASIASAISDGDAIDRGRAAIDVRAGLFDGDLQLEVATAGDFQGEYLHTSQRGAGDVYAAAAWAPRIVLSPDHELSMALEVAAFFPTAAGQGGLDSVRLVPSVHVAIPLVPQLWLRARAGAFVDLDGSGNAALVSAYAFDWRIAGPLFASAELGLTAGQEDGALLFAPVPGLSAGIVAGPLVLTAGARFAATGSALALHGAWSFVMTAEWTGIFADDLP
jgi:hypothetical protein